MGRCGIDGETLIDQDTDPLIGHKLDRYNIEARLGEGAMGCVYRAQHEFLGSVHAVKVLFGELASLRTVAQRFEQEAQVLSALKHPNVVNVTDFGQTEDGLAFLVMDHIEGPTLAKALEAGPLGEHRTRELARQIASGLDAAHALKFVHRDLKPSNIMLVTEDGVEVPKILDFGIAKDLDPEASDKLTRSGFILGTPLYMAPEQATDGRITPQADLYALGVIMFEMLAGFRPFAGTTQQVLASHIAERPPLLPPAGGLESVVAQLLEKNPDARPAGALAVVEMLQSATTPTVHTIEPAAHTPTPASESKRWPLVVGASLLAAVVLFVIAWSGRSTPSSSFVAEPLFAEPPVVKTAAPEPTTALVNTAVKDAGIAPRQVGPTPVKGLARPRVSKPRTKARAVEPIDRVGLKQKLDNVSAMLVQAQSALPPERLSAFEDKYLELSLAITPSSSQAQLAALSKRIDALAKEIERASR